ncbi:MAG: hypothetical protein ACREOZ_04210, partial [Gloeomargaritales cyanobacterium]
MNPWLIYPTWQNFSSLFRETTIAAEEKTEFLRYHHLTAALYFAISSIESLLNEKYRVRLEFERRSEEEIVLILRKHRFAEKFSQWPTLICGKEVRVSNDLKTILTDFNEIRGHLTHPKTRGHEIYAKLEKVNGQQLLEAVAEYAITVFSGLGESYPYWLFGWNYLNPDRNGDDPSRINNQQFLHSLEYFGMNVPAFNARNANAWENAHMKDFQGYKTIAQFL